MNNRSIKEVISFWETNPLFTGESKHLPGTKEFFTEHRNTIIQDNRSGYIPNHIYFPRLSPEANVADLGCGPGFWVNEMKRQGKYRNLYACDITRHAINLTAERLRLNGYQAHLSVQNIENLAFESDFFDLVNCQGVIHHTPNTQKALEEIHRILKPGGVANISIYYKNVILNFWSMLSVIGKTLGYIGAKLPGRGRENIFFENDVEEIVRLYDGKDNPIGKVYSKAEFEKMCDPMFHIVNEMQYLFPVRVFPFSIPKNIHRFLANHLGFMMNFHMVKI